MNPLLSFLTPAMLFDIALSLIFSTLRELKMQPEKKAAMRKIFLKIAKLIKENYGDDDEFSLIGKS